MVYRVGFSLSVWQRYSPVRCVAYLGWLFKEMMVSSYNVAKQLWRFCPEEGVFCVVPHPGGDSVSVPLHANSITLTPGTLTVGCNTEGTLLVHAFTKASREEVTTPALLTRILHLRRPV
jgi:multisubunit Na+/H+ antiporter MnhE subunit